MNKIFSIALFLVLALIAACSHETTITGPFNSKTPHGYSFAEISSSSEGSSVGQTPTAVNPLRKLTASAG